MNSLLMFRCHAHPAICADRIELLARYNPHLPVCGLFGGTGDAFRAMRTDVGNLVDEWYEIGMHPNWSWQNGDLAVRTWFSTRGHRLTFDRLYLIEWDLLLLDSLPRLYCHVPADAIAVTARFLLAEVADDYGWITNQRHKAEWDELLHFVRIAYGYMGSPFASLGPGTCYSRAFLERYSEAEVPELSSDELRVPLFAQCFGIPVCDTGFRRAWNDPEELTMFNCTRSEIPAELILREAAKAGGRRAFHPYRACFRTNDTRLYSSAGHRWPRNPT